jgi:hypothetical protein
MKLNSNRISKPCPKQTIKYQIKKENSLIIERLKEKKKI